MLGLKVRPGYHALLTSNWPVGRQTSRLEIISEQLINVGQMGPGSFLWLASGEGFYSRWTSQEESVTLESSLFWLCKGTLEWECWGQMPMVYTQRRTSDTHRSISTVIWAPLLIAQGLHPQPPSLFLASFPYTPCSLCMLLPPALIILSPSPATQPPCPVPSHMPLGHWSSVGCGCMGIYFQLFWFYDVQAFKAHWHLFLRLISTQVHIN